MRARLFLLLLSVSIPQSNRRESLDTPFELAVAERIAIPSHLTIEFREVSRDSRCPRGVQCIRAGEAVVVLELSLDSGEPTTVAFEVPPGAGAAERVGRYEVSIETLEPEAAEGQTIAHDAYRATVVVSRSPD